MAAENGYFYIAQLLLQYKAEVNTKDALGNTPLHLAAQKGYFDIVDLLLNREEKADVNAEMTGKYSGVTPLHFAVLGHHTNIVKYLLGYGADVNAKATGIFEDFTPLHMAVNQGYDDIVTVLLEKGGINVNARDQMGSAPLHFAGKNGCTNIVKLLLENKADVNAATNEGISTLHIAAFGNHEGIIKLLLNHGADVNAKDKAGSTPLLFSLKCRHFKVADLLLADPNINIGCIKAASISKENKEGKEKFSQKLRQDYNLFQKVKEASNEKDKGKLDKLLKEIEELLESKTEYGFKPSLNYSPDGNDENTTIEIAIKAGGKLLQFLHDYAEKNIGINTEIFKKLKRAKENSQSKRDLCDVSVLKHSTPDQGFLFSNG